MFAQRDLEAVMVEDAFIGEAVIFLFLFGPLNHFSSECIRVQSWQKMKQEVLLGR